MNGNEYLTIKEFATISGIEVSTLRYWDEIGLFTPAKRDPVNNYRYYTLTQILALHFVTVLSDLNIPLKTIAELRDDRDPEKFLEMINNHEHMLDMEMRALRERYSIIHTRRELISFGMKVDDSLVSVQWRDDKSIILWPPNEYKEGENFISPLTHYVNQRDELRINLSFPTGGYHDNLESFLRAPERPDRFFTVDPTGNRKRPEGNYLIGYDRGYYGIIKNLPGMFLDYIKENNTKVAGPVYTIYLHDEVCVKENSNFLAQSCIMVQK